MVGNFHFLFGEAFFDTTVDDNEPKYCDIKQNGEQCIESQLEMLSCPSIR